MIKVSIGGPFACGISSRLTPYRLDNLFQELFFFVAGFQGIEYKSTLLKMLQVAMSIRNHSEILSKRSADHKEVLFQIRYVHRKFLRVAKVMITVVNSKKSIMLDSR
jgi:hypothetical protein